jgi:hypothetical protein
MSSATLPPIDPRVATPLCSAVRVDEVARRDAGAPLPTVASANPAAPAVVRLLRASCYSLSVFGSGAEYADAWGGSTRG